MCEWTQLRRRCTSKLSPLFKVTLRIEVRSTGERRFLYLHSTCRCVSDTPTTPLPASQHVLASNIKCRQMIAIADEGVCPALQQRSDAVVAPQSRGSHEGRL